MGNRSKSIVDTVYALLGAAPGGSVPYGPQERYADYLAHNLPDERLLFAERKTVLSYMPRFAVAIAGEGKKKDIERTAASVEAQSYPLVTFTDNAARVDCEYVAVAFPGDTYSPEAMAEFASSVNAYPGADLLFCDEDALIGAQRAEPVLKTELSMTTLCSYNSIGRGMVLSKDLYAKAGAFTGEYAFAVRAAALAKKPVHVPRVLYTRKGRAAPDKAADEAAHTAIAEHQQNFAANETVTVTPGMYEGSFRVSAKLSGNTEVAVLIACRDRLDSLRRLLESIEDTDIYGKTHILIADGGSRDKRLLRYLDLLEGSGAAEIVHSPEYSYPALMNQAARRAAADAFLFLDVDTEAVSPRFITALLEQLERRGVGAVGGKLTGTRGELVHTGLTVGIRGFADSPYRNTPDNADEWRKRRFTDSIRAVTALSGAFMMVGSATFFDAGGFDETFGERGADVEFCVRLMRRKLTNIYTPYAHMRFHGAPRLIEEGTDQDIMRFYDACRELLVRSDPYYNPNFDYASLIPRIAPEPYPAVKIFRKKRGIN